MCGDTGRRGPVEEILEHTFVRALMLEAGGTRGGIVALELLWR